MKTKTIIVLLAISALAGCASSGDYSTYVAAQSEANRKAVDDQKPLVEIEAQEGQQITGLRRIRVFAPTTAPVIQQARGSEGWGVASQAISVVGSVMGIRYAGQAAEGLARAVGDSATKGYASVQAPQANVSNVNIDKSNHSVTTGATSSIVGSYNPTSDSSTRPITIDSSTRPTTTTTTTGVVP